LPALGDLIVGRSQKANVWIDDRSVSRRHARMVLGATVRVVGLESYNGTSVGNKKLTPVGAADIHSGDSSTWAKTA
jgi:pSer/pThr/pTyr-binding forkhead associated (FHA) protein